MPSRALAVVVILTAALAGACGRGHDPLPDQVPEGTWGGDDAGMIVGSDGVHVHVGCTLGDIPRAIPLDGDGRFDVPGTYNVDAFPVDRGIRHPAQFTGRTDGRTLTFTARLTDTGQTFESGVLHLGRASDAELPDLSLIQEGSGSLSVGL